MLSALLSLVHR